MTINIPSKVLVNQATSLTLGLLSKKQSSVSLSTAEAEYIVAHSACCEAIWIQKLMLGLFDMELDTTIILYDNQSFINMTENMVFHDKSKHIEIQYFYIRNMV